ncbi:DNA repair protein RecO [Lutimaribacter sp. EGI FJ00015]|uniref:DNA repair protein RecO n=1 Tax=Lutimaribacter degradans TaxID=2945989 RepID=A0ACC5ZW90_9RHOB|nr:DNA repair protein RecO [Lutimaribacter sp. EGI FJ00013]MCM2562628.1 DNA repair protein RecO [Lutimaribacter sp. EGI FJ00013]MCO0613785.1 DNA repair protein RecO [Lutimaribacter sp. EGI FJ00015]MCO0636732.1 DNA repair protein RecO [Lutimaribacter sp. EGI FJ00014]
MEWRDQGILLHSRRHGESAAIIEVFTPSRGRHAGVVRGGAGRRMAPVLQPGAQLDVTWRARLEDHIGAFTVEPVRSRIEAMGDRLSLAGLNAVLALLHFALPEREAHGALYLHSENLLDLLGDADLWPLAYLRWEMTLLEELGYGLDLSTCAVTGARAGLVYISPKSGRAVSAAGAGEWADRLLPLPQCLLGQGDASDAEIIEGLGVTGHFLANHMAYDMGDKPLPEARHRFVDAMQRRLARNG